MLPRNSVHLGDCLEYIDLVKDNSIDLIILDPPYLTTDKRWDKKEVVTQYLSDKLIKKAKESCSLYVWCGIGEKSQSLIRWFPIFNDRWYFKDLITWKKQRGNGNRKGWLYTREEIMWFVISNKQFVWNKEYQYDLSDKRLFSLPNNKSPFKRWTNVWTDIKESAGSMKSSQYHWCEKPIPALERLILVHTKEGDLVLDCFAGSGSTALACINTKRDYILIEKDEKEYNTCLNRIANHVA